MSMDLRRLLGDSSVPAVPLAGLASDSRRVLAGEAFFAVRGRDFDGHDFAAEAVAAGAAAVVSERPIAVSVPNVVQPGIGDRLGVLARRFYGEPGRALRVVGVTGTNGKTTFAYNLAQIVAHGACIGTLGWGRPPRLCPSTLTTADPITLQRELRALVDAGVRHVAVEASSHALDQGRLDAVDFDLAVFTNLGRDHLDYHGDMASYAAAKKRLFERPLDAAVINVDAPFGAEVAAYTAPRCDTLRVGAGAGHDVGWTDLDFQADGVSGVWHSRWGRRRFALPGYFGSFSVANAALAVAAACRLEVPLADAVAAMAALPAVPGRLQMISQAPRVLVDYAHTADGLAAVLAALRRHFPAAPGGGRLVVLFGCGGDRDRGKRALMARAVEEGADVAVATSDNPRHEHPERILDDVMAGFQHPDAVLRIADRRAAIEAAVGLAEAGDVVLLAGKGHERTQSVAGAEIEFSDAEVAAEAVARWCRRTGS